MSDPQDDLRSTEESIRRDAERVALLEEQKASLDPTDPRVAHLSERVERLVDGLRGKAAAEREIAHEISSEG